MTETGRRSITRRHSLEKLRAGDYLLASNDGATLYRITRAIDGLSGGHAEWRRERPVWAAWRWPDPIAADLALDVTDWSRWVLVADTDSFADAIGSALDDGERRPT